MHAYFQIFREYHSISSFILLFILRHIQHRLLIFYNSSSLIFPYRIQKHFTTAWMCNKFANSDTWTVIIHAYYAHAAKWTFRSDTEMFRKFFVNFQVICPIGQHCPPGSVAPADCLPGTYTSYEGASECMTCPEGTLYMYMYIHCTTMFVSLS